MATAQIPGTGLGPSLAGWTANGPGPLYRRLAESIRGAIRRAEMPSGTRLPTERALAAELSVSRSTVVAAYDLLREESWLESRQGSGTWVRRHASVVRFGEDRAGFVGRATTSFRALIEGPGEGIEFTCAALAAGDLFSRPGMSRALEEIDRAAREGIGYEAIGHAPLRAAIADHLTRRWRMPTTTDEVIVTTGAQQAVGLAAALYARPGDVALVEDPTYLTAIDMFTASGARLISVPIGVQGLRPERLRDAMFATSPRLAYLMPTFHNPTGTLMPERERREVAELAQELQVPIVEDLTVADLTLGGDPPPPIGAFQGDVPVLSIGSLSKILWGGLRIGWIRAPAPVVQRLARMKLVTDHGTSTVSQILAVPIVEDLTVADLTLGGDPPPPIGAFQGDVPVLLIGSLSKILWGGLRIGWIRAPAPVVQRLARMKLVTDHGTSTVSQILALPLLEDLDEILVERRALLHERKEMLEGLLREHLPAWSWDAPAGGLCLWVRLADADATAFSHVATRHGVTVVPGPMTSVDGNFPDRVRLPFVLEPDQMREGVERLARAWEEFQRDSTQAPRAVRIVV